MNTPTSPQPLHLRSSQFAPGLTVIEASAGTGKTYSISHLVPRLLLEGTLPDLSRLLLVTFTKDAARELADRVRRVLAILAAPPVADPGVETEDIAALRVRLVADGAATVRLRRAMANLDHLAVSTIHAFCQRTLQQEGALCGLPVLPEVVTDDSEQRRLALRQAWSGRLRKDPFMAAIATGLEWSLDDAKTVADAFRRVPPPVPRPEPRRMEAVRAEMEPLIASLAVAENWADIRERVGTVSKWNKGGPSDSAEAIDWLRPIHEGSARDARFWFAVSRAVKLLWGTVPKASRAGIESSTWHADTSRLVRLASELQWAWQLELAHEVDQAVRRTLGRHRLITQDGLIGALHDALDGTGPDGRPTAQAERLATRLADRYQIALVDESQDTDPRQFAIFKRIFLREEQPRHLILVGDPKQAIYGFRGADLETYLTARDQARNRFTLNRTFRSPQALVDAVNRLFAGPRPFLNPAMTFEPAVSGLDRDVQLLVGGRRQSRLDVWLLPDSGKGSLNGKTGRVRGLSARVATVITHLLRDGAILRTVDPGGKVHAESPVTSADIAVLVATNAQADTMAEALQERGVPVVINSGADVFDTDEARDLLLLLKAIVTPRRKTGLRAALATRLIGLDATRLARLIANDPASADGATAEATEWLDLFTHWKSRWEDHGLAALFADLESPDPGPMTLGVTHRLALIPFTGERRATNHRQLTDLLLLASRDEADSPEDLVRWLGQQITRAETRADVEERQLQLSTDRDAVQILTLHACKGLEFPLVFCPYLAEPLHKARTIDTLRNAAAPGAEGRRDELVHQGLLEGEDKETTSWRLATVQLEERLRLAYVALTRAKVRVWTVSYSYSNREQGKKVNPLDWLLDRPDAGEGCSGTWEATVNSGRAARHQAALERLGARHRDDAPPKDGPWMTFGPPPDPDATRLGRDSAGEVGQLVPAPMPPKIPDPWRVTSFSTLTRDRSVHGDEPRKEEEDQDESTTRVPHRVDPGHLFLGAPGGAEVGTVLHDWIEGWDFRPFDPVALAEHLRKGPRLPEPPAGTPAWEDILGNLLGRLREIRLPGAGDLPLHQLCPDRHASEWHFHLPLREDVSFAHLVDCFRHHAPESQSQYADRLDALSQKVGRGFLQGFIDRLMRTGDSWGVIDWKTNRLGTGLEDYVEEELMQCAMDSHYLLQCHLYLVALRRHLRFLDLPRTHANQSWLVFLRGIEPGTSRGVLRIQPSDAMLTALDTLFVPCTR